MSGAGGEKLIAESARGAVYQPLQIEHLGLSFNIRYFDPIHPLGFEVGHGSLYNVLEPKRVPRNAGIGVVEFRVGPLLDRQGSGA